MEAAFVVLRARSGGHLTDAQRALTTGAAPPGLPFVASDHESWTSPDRSVVFGAWKKRHPFLGGGIPWIVDDRGVSMCCGHVWPGGTGDWPSDEERARRVRRGAEEQRGIYIAVDIPVDGATRAWSDPLGYRYLYYGERDGVGAIGSHAALVAWALAQDDHPRRDAFGVCSLAQRRVQLGRLTGFEGVHVAGVGEVAHLSSTGLRIDALPHPCVPDEDMRRLSPPAVIDAIASDMSEVIAGAGGAPTPTVIMDLTGGKDSRVVLALTLAAGLEDRFHFRTIGPPELGDVVVAARLAEQYELSHSVERGFPADSMSYADRLRRFTARTCGMTSIWNAASPSAPEEFVRVQGIPGEILRALRVVPADLSSVEDLTRFCTQRIFRSQLGLLRQDVADAYINIDRDTLQDERLDGLSLADRYHAYQVSGQRSARFGVLEEVKSQARVLPFYSRRVIAAATALGPDARRRQWAHHELVGRGGTALVREPFAGEGWPAELAVATTPVGPAATTTQPDGEPLILRAHRRAFDQRRQFFEEIVSDTSNRAWDLIDRAAVQQALADFPSLSGRSKQEVFGAMTAVLWLDEADAGPAG